MRMQVITTTVLTAGVLTTQQIDYDRLNPLSREIVHRVTVVTEAKEERKNGSPFAGGFLDRI